MASIPTYEIIDKPNQLNNDDIVIALMGPTGSGKSNIIDKLCGTKRAGSKLSSCTSTVEAVRVNNHKIYGNRLILIDTPGFDDTYKSDFEILQMLSDWLAQMHKESTKLTGILYLHRITDNRMGGTPTRNLRMFGKLTGDKAARNIVFVSTGWDKLTKLEMGERRERDLARNFWKVMIDNGATIARSDNNPDTVSRIILDVAARHSEGVSLLIQEELVDLHRQLNETAAGQEVYSKLMGLIDQQKRTVAELSVQLRNYADPETTKKLLDDLADMKAKLEKEIEEAQKLHLSIFRKFRLMIFGKRAGGHAINMG